jgi:hypothetical protein
MSTSNQNQARKGGAHPTGGQADAAPALHRHAAKERGGLDAAKKWIGFGAAALSALTAAYGSLEYQAEKKARAQHSVALLDRAQIQEQASDYPGAWASLQGAIKEIDEEGILVRALGGLSTEQARVHTAEEDLAMQWLRVAVDRVPEGHKPSEVTDEVLGVLSSGAAHATGVRKADLLAHIGWAYELKADDGTQGLKVEQFYKDAIAIDPTNPYANTFWARAMVFETSASEAGMAQVKRLFSAALSSDRAKGELRHWIRANEWESVRRWMNYPAAQAFFWQMVGEMHKAGEPLGDELLTEMRDGYLGNTVGVPAFTENVNHLLVYLPDPAVHVELLRQLVAANSGSQQGYLQVCLAVALEKAGNPQAALAALRAAKSGEAGAALSNGGLNEQIARLSGAPAAPTAKPAAKPAARHH